MNPTNLPVGLTELFNFRMTTGQGEKNSQPKLVEFRLKLIMSHPARVV